MTIAAVHPMTVASAVVSTVAASIAAAGMVPLVTPQGHLRAVPEPGSAPLAADIGLRIAAAFGQGAGPGLLQLGASEVTTSLPPSWAWWRDVAARYVTALCATPDGVPISVAAPDPDALAALTAAAPPMTGAEYLTPQVLAGLWGELDAATRAALAASNLSLQDFLKARHAAWNQVGRVHFNLAENRKDADAPFAFLATYTSRLSAHGKAQHLPLSRALEEFSGGKNSAQLLSLLMPVQRAAAGCGWLREMVEQGEIYHPLRWSSADAWRFLSDTPKLAAAGIVVRAPGVWPGGRPLRPSVTARVGTRAPSLLGQEALLDFQMEVTLDGERLSAADLRALLAGGDGLQLMRGSWVEVDGKRLARLLARFEAVDAAARKEGLPFGAAMRLVAGAALDEAGDAEDADWSKLVAGDWLAATLKGLRQPEGLAEVSAGAALKATLRPYQEAGLRWLYLLNRLGLGACLADDMGLGKTIQVLALLLVLQREQRAAVAATAATAATTATTTNAAHANMAHPSLLVAPASLLANWAAEAQRFAPGLKLMIAHPSAMPAAELAALGPARLKQVDLVITSYGTLLRAPALTDAQWQVAVLDEAQAIKNPGAKQTRLVKKLHARTRIALTGTPVENRLSDLWSIFDFTHPGLLGSEKVFAGFTRRLGESGQFGPLRALVAPYILRRLKTDKTVISDLPDKTELTAWCHLSPVQAALYQQAVKELAAALDAAKDGTGIARKGLVLSYLMRFKQICNHPSQWLGDAAWGAQDSGKFARLKELADVVAARQEKLLVFTQFRETTEPLAAFLGAIFGRAGLVLHGGTPVARRRELVERFQNDELTPFFVLSLKAGGAGLNLTAASHVIHFDRWWNPAVENQATDRAFRIGQQRNVLVHKFTCRGTVEDRIDQLIESKKQLVKDVLEGGAARLITEMNDHELLDLVRLDIHAARDN